MTPTETRIHSKYDFIHTIDGVRCLISAADLYQNAGFKLDIHHWRVLPISAFYKHNEWN